MQPTRPLLAAALGALGLTLAGTASAIVQGHRESPVVDLDNPCTSGHDSIDGVFNLSYTAVRDANGVTTVFLSGRGSGADVNNLFFRFLASGTLQFHRPLPADIN